jgi:DNA polymerase-1
MRHHLFCEPHENPDNQYKVAVLIKGSSFVKGELTRYYVEPLLAACNGSVAFKDVIAFTLEYNENDKAPTGHIKDYLNKLMLGLNGLGVTHLYVADSAFFKVLAGVPKSEPHQGYALPVKFQADQFGHMTCVLGLNYRQLIFDPALQPKLDTSIKALSTTIDGTYQAPGQGIIHSAFYPKTLEEISNSLESLCELPSLTCDIEAFSLDFDKAGIGTIAFAWDRHNGVAFACDYMNLAEPANGEHGYMYVNSDVRALLRAFFEAYEGELTFHNAGYDVKVLIATLWMKHFGDTAGLLRGLEILTRKGKFHDTKIMVYLATNSTAGNSLSLKTNAQEFAGNWAVDEIKDIRRVPLQQLLQYNLVDALSTWYVREKHEPIVKADAQWELYTGLMLPSAAMLIQTELTGLPLSKRRVQEVKKKLQDIQADKMLVIRASPLVDQVNLLIRQAAWQKDFDDRRGKAKKPDKILPKNIKAFDHLEFNPNSDPQMRRLLHEVMGLPILDTTDTGLASTGADTIKKLLNHTQDPAAKELLEAILVFAGVSTIVSTFIPAFENAISHGDADPDIVWLHGNFNLGGTVSGRLSSSDPNLTNIPAKVTVKVGGMKIDLGKLVKYCFVSPPGSIFCGADFNSLEDMISALTTKDPNKLKVYAGSKQFDVCINGVTHRIREEDVVNFDGQEITGIQLYAQLSNCSPRDVHDL